MRRAQPLTPELRRDDSTFDQRRALRRAWGGVALAALISAIVPTAQAAGASVLEATAEQKQEAQDKYVVALEEFEMGDFAEALQLFRASHAVVASPNSRLMAARALVKLNRPAEAYNELTLTRREAAAIKSKDPAYEQTEQAAAELQKELRPQVALLTVDLGDQRDAVQSLKVGDTPYQPDELRTPVAVPPGEIAVTATLKEGEPLTQSTKLAAGAQGSVRFTAPEEEPPYFRGPEPHPRHLVDLEGHLVLGLLDPPGPSAPGLGIGARASIVLLNNLVKPLNDSFGVGAGVDFVALSSESHVWLPFVLQYSLWFSPTIAAFVEPGFAVLLHDDTWVRPAVYGGGRFSFSDRVALTARFGYPNSTIGVSLLF